MEGEVNVKELIFLCLIHDIKGKQKKSLYLQINRERSNRIYDR